MSIETNAAVVDGQVLTHPAADSRLNNVSELRLLFAASVVLSHAAALIGDNSHYLLRVILNSEAAVQGFFILSGYLVCGSYDRIRSPVAFYKRRFLRIYPAYFVAVILFIGLGLGQALMLGDPVSWGTLPRYLIANLSTLNFLQPSVGGVFARNSVDVVNGALWSIKVEMMFYAGLPLLYVLAKRFSFVALAMMLIFIGAAWWPVLAWIGEQRGVAIPLSFKYQLPGQLHYFGLGIALFARSKGHLSVRALALVTGWTLLLLLLFGETREALHALVLVVLVGGVSALPQMPDIFGGNDISYGIYLCHFPLIQLLLAAGLGQLPFLLYLAVVVALTVAYGLFSWTSIERPALSIRWNGHK